MSSLPITHRLRNPVSIRHRMDNMVATNDPRLMEMIDDMLVDTGPHLDRIMAYLVDQRMLPDNPMGYSMFAISLFNKTYSEARCDDKGIDEAMMIAQSVTMNHPAIQRLSAQGISDIMSSIVMTQPAYFERASIPIMEEE